MQKQLRVALLQADLVWENPIENRLEFSKRIGKLKSDLDLVVLPEMFTTGFTMNPTLVAESMQGTTVEWMQHTSKSNGIAIMGSIVVEEQGDFFNRLLFVEPNGEISFYDKRHTFTLAGEHLVYTAGKNHNVIEYLGWKIMPMICYDLRFPVWSRNTMDYDVVIYVANWPEPRIAAWDALLKARAIENMSYCIGVNRVGQDANELTYPGHSAAYDLFGNEIAQCKHHLDDHVVVNLNKDHLKKYRQKLQFLNDRDSFSLT